MAALVPGIFINKADAISWVNIAQLALKVYSAALFAANTASFSLAPCCIYLLYVSSQLLPASIAFSPYLLTVACNKDAPITFSTLVNLSTSCNTLPIPPTNFTAPNPGNSNEAVDATDGNCFIYQDQCVISCNIDPSGSAA